MPNKRRPTHSAQSGFGAKISDIKRSFHRSLRRFSRMNGRGKAIVLGAGGLVLVGLVLLIALPGKGKKPAELPTMEENALITLPDGSTQAAEASGEQVMAFSATPAPTPEPTPVPTPTPDPTLEKGMEGEEVKELQQRLMNLGFMTDDEPTEYFGSITKNAVELFQRQHGLQQDGIAGIHTLDMIYSSDAKHYTLLEGFEGTDVESFQRQLKDLGYLSKVTGYYGTETIEAVKSFQKENKLSQDGLAGEKTFNLINSDDAKPHPSVAKQKRRKANINKMIEVAKSKLGCKYILGAEGPKTFDCSGLVYYCLKEAGSNRRRLNAAGYSRVEDWEKITKLSTSSLEKGDLLFFYNNGKTKVGHVGIYIGGGEMVDASSSNGKVVRRSCMTSYWKNHFVCARRPW